MKNYKIFFLFILINVFTITSCDDYLDINDDPNNPVDAEINNLMPFSQGAIVGSLCIGNAGISESVSLYIHHIVLRGAHVAYQIPENEIALVQ